MGFASGSVSFRRFKVSGDKPKAIDADLLQRLADHILKPTEFGAPPEEEYGWSGGRHVFDSHFSHEHNVFADCLNFALRIDTNKPPAALKKAYTLMEEEAVAAGNPSGFISKNQKKDVKETIRQKMEEELRSGKHRRSKLVPILWDVEHETLYSTAAGSSWEKLAELFERTFNLRLEQTSAGTLALDWMEQRGKRRDYEDLRPTRFALGPAGESQAPDYPWIAKGAEPKDVLGNEFLLWLWHEADARTGIVGTEEAGDVTVFIDRTLQIDCVYGETGKDTFTGAGPSRMPEARDGLRSGKAPRKAGLILDANGMQWNLTLSAESFMVGAAKLPDVEEADSPRVLFEERIALLRDLCKTLDALYGSFLKIRATSGWEGHVNQMRRWIAQAPKSNANAA